MRHNSYRDFLKDILVERQKINSSYSLRAFAQSIGICSSHLSRVLEGKQGISVKKAQAIADIIGLNCTEKNIFCLMVQSSDARSKNERKLAYDKLKFVIDHKENKYSHDCHIEDYEILREWYNIAILELMDTKNFSSSPEWIAQEIGISPLLVRESIKKLTKIGVVRTSSGKLVKKHRNLKIDQSVPSDIMKNYYAQLLSKAKDSIYMQNLSERHLSSVTVSIDDTDIELLQKEIDQFRSHFNHLVETLSDQKGKKRNTVYCLTTQFFKINKGEKK